MILLIFAVLVIAEFGLHVIYHAVTGKAGLNDAPFDYLKSICKDVRRESSDIDWRNKRI